MRDDTDWHMHYPEPGDRFYEFASSYIEVIDVSSAGVSVIEHIPQTRLKYYNSVGDFRDAYRRSDDPHGYIVRYQGNGREH